MLLFLQLTEKKNFEEKIKKNLNFLMFMAYNTPWPPMSVHKKFQPIWFSRLAGYREHVYKCLVLLFRISSNMRCGSLTLFIPLEIKIKI